MFQTKSNIAVQAIAAAMGWVVPNKKIYSEPARLSRTPEEVAKLKANAAAKRERKGRKRYNDYMKCKANYHPLAS